MNPNDVIREAVLRFLYDKQRKGRGIHSGEMGIREIRQEMKSLGHKSNAVTSNMNFLIDGGWILEKKRAYTVTTPRGINIPQEQVKYKISDKGVSYFEGPSKFQASRATAGINITNIRGVTVVGDGNVVQNQYSDLFNALDLLGDALRKSDSVTDDEKLSYQADIETLKSQLSKPVPNSSIVGAAWASIVALANIEGLAQFVERVEGLIGALL